MDKPKYQVSSIDLSDADERALKVFLRFVGNTEAAGWQWSTRDACDLLIMGAGVPPPASVSNLLAPVLAWVEDAGEKGLPSSEKILTRPLQMDDFSELLRSVELGFKDRVRKIEVPAPRYSEEPRVIPAPAVSPVALPVPAPVPQPVPAPVAAPIPVRAPIPASAPVSIPAPAPAPLLQQHKPETAPPERTGRYRLARWPKADFLRGRARATRFLSFLASGPLTVEQLCTLSGADRTTCTTLLDALDAAGYLETRPAQAAVMAQASARSNSGAHAAALTRASTVRPMTGLDAPTGRRPAVPPPDVGIFGRLRRHLGLG